MLSKTTEIEIKLPITDKQAIITQLESIGAKYIDTVEQTDVLFNSPHVDFAVKDEALRVRKEKNKEGERISLTYKGEPTHSADGHKSRDEFEVQVSDFEITKKILLAIRFFEVATVQKKRTIYHVGQVEIAIDELSFGMFLEIEGESSAIETVRKQLGLAHVKPESRGYVFLQDGRRNVSSMKD